MRRRETKIAKKFFSDKELEFMGDVSGIEGFHHDLFNIRWPMLLKQFEMASNARSYSRAFLRAIEICASFYFRRNKLKFDSATRAVNTYAFSGLDFADRQRSVALHGDPIALVGAESTCTTWIGRKLFAALLASKGGAGHNKSLLTKGWADIVHGGEGLVSVPDFSRRFMRPFLSLVNYTTEAVIVADFQRTIDRALAG